jgi:hypothetical protein
MSTDAVDIVGWKSESTAQVSQSCSIIRVRLLRIRHYRKIEAQGRNMRTVGQFRDYGFWLIDADALL